MTIALSNIQELIERSLFERLRLACVEYGYLPDINSYADNPTGYASYLTALQTVITNKGFAIEVFGVSSKLAKYEKVIPRMVLDSFGFVPGSVGGDISQQFKLQTIDDVDSYYGYFTPPNNSDYHFNLYVTSGKSSQNRIMNAIISLALPSRGYIPIYNDSNSLILTELLSMVPNYEKNNSDVMENIYRYVIRDIYQYEMILSGNTVAPLIEVDLDLSGEHTIIE